MQDLRYLTCAAVTTLMVGMAGAAEAQDCVTIQDAELMTSDGRLIAPGYDEWGYNYQAHTFNGGYCEAYRNAPWCAEFADEDLMLKWNDAWLSNKDCNNDGLLDRHFGSASYLGSEAWLTNHISGTYEVETANGRFRQAKWTYFVKIIAAPEDGYKSDGKWYTAGGAELGPVIWGDFAIIEEIINDPANGQNGPVYRTPHGPGVGSGHVE